MGAGNEELDMSQIYDPNINTPTGAVLMWPAAAAPVGWLLCDGASLLRADYPDLFGVIGVVYGTADSTHFTLPDFRGVYPKGAGTTARALGVDATGAYYNATLGAYAQDAMQGHFHTYTSPNAAVTDMGSGGYTVIRARTTTSSTTAPITDGAHGTPRVDKSTEPQNLGIGFIIKY